MSIEPDVVVIGAGAAGVGAGLALARLGIPCLIIEAKDRMGGRAYTDTTSLGVPWDHGCHWFHSADRNPLRALADRLGHAYVHEPRGATAPIYMNGSWDTSGQARLHVWDELDRVTASRADVPAEAIIDSGHPQADLVRHWISLMTSGEARDISASDYGRYDDSHVNLPVRDGYGALVARIARGLPIRLACPARRIARTKHGFEVETPEGTLKPRAAIVTASVNVLLSGEIKFSPALPADLLSALENVPCGSYEKVVIRFEGDPFGGFSSEFCDIFDPPGSHPINVEVGHHGRPLAIAHFAGDMARDLAAAGQPAMIDFLKQKLVSAFGGAIAKAMNGGTTTAWGADPFIRGGYAYARAGHAASRDVMIAADLAPLYLAGEAFHSSLSATAHGAYLSGIDAAHRAARAMGRETVAPDPLWLPQSDR
ncbi:MAG: flavin monoamine oxidase family protein [Parvibaculaceae bacterium]